MGPVGNQAFARYSRSAGSLEQGSLARGVDEDLGGIGFGTALFFRQNGRAAAAVHDGPGELAVVENGDAFPQQQLLQGDNTFGKGEPGLIALGRMLQISRTAAPVVGEGIVTILNGSVEQFFCLTADNLSAMTVTEGQIVGNDAGCSQAAGHDAFFQQQHFAAHSGCGDSSADAGKAASNDDYVIAARQRIGGLRRPGNRDGLFAQRASHPFA